MKSEGILEEAEILAIKRVIAYQVQKEMKQKNISQQAMAERLKTSRTAIKRLLDPNNLSITLYTLSKLAKALDKRLIVSLENINIRKNPRKIKLQMLYQINPKKYNLLLKKFKSNGFYFFNNKL